MTILDLHNSNVDKLTRNTVSSDFLKNAVFPIFNLQKVAYMCSAPTILVIDGIKSHCDLHSVSFMNSPQIIMLNEKIVWSKQENIETEFLQKKLNWNFPDLNPLLTDHNVFSNKIHATHPLDSLVHFCNEIDTGHPGDHGNNLPDSHSRPLVLLLSYHSQQAMLLCQ